MPVYERPALLGARYQVKLTVTSWYNPARRAYLNGIEPTVPNYPILHLLTCTSVFFSPIGDYGFEKRQEYNHWL